MTLEQLAADLQTRIEDETNPAKLEVFTIIASLVKFLQDEDADSDPLYAENEALKQKVNSLQSLLDNDAVTFDAIKTALGNPNLTQGELADEIRTKWRKI